MQTYELSLFADYHQFYLQDELAEGNLSEVWTDDAVREMLALTSGTIGVMTYRNTVVQVIVQICDSPPKRIDLDVWDRINECRIDVPSGRMVIAGCSDYFPDAKRIIIDPGIYHARIFYGGERTITADGLSGKDHYKIELWPDSFKDI